MASISNELWATSAYIPHGHCYLWQPELVWLHLLADGFTALAYYSIPALLIYFARQRPDVGLNKLIWLFSAFIITCGTTHLMAIWTLWHPTYWLSGALKTVMVGAMWNVADLIATAIDTVQPLADKVNVRLVTQPRSENICVDADRIVQTLTNLLSNAIKFSPPGSTVEYLVEREPDYLRFEIRDRGRGIPADKLETIFERFQQVDSSDARNHEGTGLGLAICRSIVGQHNGQIWAQSVLGAGSSFYFRLPALRGVAEEA